MTLPIYMKNRAASPFGVTLRDLEANVVFSLAHRFAPALSPGADYEDYLMMMMDAIVPGQEQEANNKHNITPPPPDDDAADDASEKPQEISPPSSPEQEDRPAKRARRMMTSRRPAWVAGAGTRTSCSLPTADDPIDESFLTFLYSPYDEGRINPTHVIVRRDVLEVRRTASGRVLLQCACCKHLPRGERARLSTLAPRSVGNLYRAMVRFMMNHVPACGEMPREIRELSPKASRVVNERGAKKYWVESALRKGLRDREDGMSIVYCPPSERED